MNNTRFAIGIVCIIGGIFLSLITYYSAKEGGTYYIFWGLVLYGIIQIIRSASEGNDDNNKRNLVSTRIVYSPDMVFKDPNSYYVLFKNKEYGPYTFDKMKSLFRERKIVAEQPVKYGYDSDWKKLKDFKELFHGDTTT